MFNQSINPSTLTTSSAHTVMTLLPIYIVFQIGFIRSGAWFCNMDTGFVINCGELGAELFRGKWKMWGNGGVSVWFARLAWRG